MVLALDKLWFVILIVFLAIFCIAYLISAPVWLALVLAVIIIGLLLTAISVVSKRRREKTPAGSDETMLLEYLKSHGIGGSLSQVAEGSGIAEGKALELLLSMEKRGTIPEGSVKALGASLPDGKVI
jgi:hypothetical protein